MEPRDLELPVLKPMGSLSTNLFPKNFLVNGKRALPQDIITPYSIGEKKPLNFQTGNSSTSTFQGQVSQNAVGMNGPARERRMSLPINSSQGKRAKGGMRKRKKRKSSKSRSLTSLSSLKNGQRNNIKVNFIQNEIFLTFKNPVDKSGINLKILFVPKLNKMCLMRSLGRSKSKNSDIEFEILNMYNERHNFRKKSCLKMIQSVFDCFLEVMSNRNLSVPKGGTDNLIKEVTKGCLEMKSEMSKEYGYDLRVPLEIWNIVFSFLDLSNVIKLACISRYMFEMIEHSKVIMERKDISSIPDYYVNNYLKDGSRTMYLISSVCEHKPSRIQIIKSNLLKKSEKVQLESKYLVTKLEQKFKIEKVYSVHDERHNKPIMEIGTAKGTNFKFFSRKSGDLILFQHFDYLIVKEQRKKQTEQLAVTGKFETKRFRIFDNNEVVHDVDFLICNEKIVVIKENEIDMYGIASDEEEYRKFDQISLFNRDLENVQSVGSRLYVFAKSGVGIYDYVLSVYQVKKKDNSLKFLLTIKTETYFPPIWIDRTSFIIFGKNIQIFKSSKNPPYFVLEHDLKNLSNFQEWSLSRDYGVLVTGMYLFRVMNKEPLLAICIEGKKIIFWKCSEDCLLFKFNLTKHFGKMVRLLDMSLCYNKFYLLLRQEMDSNSKKITHFCSLK